MKHMKKHSIKLLAGLALLLGLSQCQETDPKPEVKNTSFSSPSAFLKSHAPVVQKVTLNLSTTQSITSENGWKYTFTPNTFAKVSNSAIVNSNIELDITEYTSNADMIYSGITTTTTGNRILESGAMFNINASSKGEVLYVVKDYEMSIPTEDPKDDMFTFSGMTNGNDSVNNITWIQSDSNNNPATVVDSGNDKYYFVRFRFLSWCNLDRYLNAGSGSSVHCKIPTEYMSATTKAYMIYEEKSVVSLYNDFSKSEFHSSNFILPLGWEIKFLIVAIKDGKLYYALVETTIVDKHMVTVDELTAISDEDLTDLINGL
jgi:hypothetical protein